MVYLYTCFSEAPLSFKTLLSLPKSRMIKKSVVMCRCFRSFCLFSVVYLSGIDEPFLATTSRFHCRVVWQQENKKQKQRKEEKKWRRWFCWSGRSASARPPRLSHTSRFPKTEKQTLPTDVCLSVWLTLPFDEKGNNSRGEKVIWKKMDKRRVKLPPHRCVVLCVLCCVCVCVWNGGGLECAVMNHSERFERFHDTTGHRSKSFYKVGEVATHTHTHRTHKGTHKHTL